MHNVTALLIVGLAIVLNAAIFVVGWLWTKHQVRLVASERAAGYRGLFRLHPLPPPGDEVQVLVEDECDTIEEIDGVHWPYLGWVDARTLLAVEGEVLGWRRHPFQGTTPDDTSTLSREKVAAELAKLTRDDDAT